MWVRLMKRLAVTSVLFLFSYSIAAADFSGPVVSVLDGDTIKVLNGHHTERIRLSGIDCPEKGQAFGKRAKQATSALVFGGDVILQTYGKDKYRRTLADVLLPDGTNVNHELVKDGWCWWYRKYAPGNTELEELEKSARDEKNGLWQDPAPIPPWVYRKARRGHALDLSDIVPLESGVEESVSSRAPPVLRAIGEDLASSKTSPYPIIGNRKSRIYHRPDCPNYSQIAPRNRIAFNATAEAEAAGFRLSGNCP